MKRRSFLKGLLAAVCAPLVALKALAVEPKWMPGHVWNYLKGGKRWTQITITTVSSTKQYPDTFRVWPTPSPSGWTKADEEVWDMSEIEFNADDKQFVDRWTKADEIIMRTECLINPFLPPDYVKTLKKLGY